MRRDQAGMVALRHVLAALEHQVLEQVREAASPALLVARADVVDDGDGHGGRGAVDVDHHPQAIVELVPLDREIEIESERRGALLGLGGLHRRDLRGRGRRRDRGPLELALLRRGDPGLARLGFGRGHREREAEQEAERPCGLDRATHRRG